jgi:hypothetical protein
VKAAFIGRVLGVDDAVADPWGPMSAILPIAAGQQRRVGFVFPLGEESANIMRKAGTFYLWKGRFIGEAKVVVSSAS